MKRISLFILFILSLAGCNELEPVSSEPSVNFAAVQEYIITRLDETAQELDQMAAAPDPEQARVHFVRARHAFKAAEPFAAYFNGDNVHKVNGPPLPVYREDNGKVLEPVSLQAIDEQLYSDEPLDTGMLVYRARILKGFLKNLRETVEAREITPRRFFVPVHQQLLSIFSLSLISFDTPSSADGLTDAVVSLKSIREVYQMSIADTVRHLDQELHQQFIGQLARAVDFIEEHPDFEQFNRYEFAREYLNPLTRSWVQIRLTTGLFADPKIYAINLDAHTFFEKNSFNVANFRSSSNRKVSEEQIDLGRELFFDERLSASGNLSCASCHQPENAWQDGLTTGVDKEGQPLQRNTPTLINAVYQKKFFWDGRSDNLEQQINVVFDTKEEFNHAGHTISLDILDDPYFLDNLSRLYDKLKPSRNEIVKALASFTSTLQAFDSRFDRNMRGETDDFTAQEVEGMNLFMGKALCATCHFVPLTNGTVPPAFSETEKEILGVPETAENRKVDDDMGFYWVFRENIHKYMFKTPTIRNIQHTAPYMHNGVYETLEEVMDFYNRGGGGGMGFALEHQTLPFDSLSLNDEEIEAIIAFMKTFSDTRLESGYSAEVPQKLATSE